MSVEQFKTATKRVIGVVGGLEAAATVVRVGRTQLSDYGNRHAPLVVPVDVAVALDICAQEPVILSAMAQAEGFALVPLSIGEGDVALSMERVAARAGATMATAMRVFADGVLTDVERQELAGELAELVAVANRALSAVRTPQAPASRSAGDILRAVQG